MKFPSLISLWFAALIFQSCGKQNAQRGPVEPEVRIVDKGYKTPTTYSGYSPQWSDEFSADTIDSTAWSFEIGRGGNGWGNDELQYYTAANAKVRNGFLVITARKESMGGAAYTSSRMITKNKKHFKFARIDIRAKLPSGQGIWPALWMLGANIDTVGWPLCGEIDIMEMVGHEPNKIYGTLHWGSSTGTHRSEGFWTTMPTGKYSDEFHVYSLLWQEDSISIMVDDKPYFRFSPADVEPDTYPFNAPYYLLFNVAVGGTWPGSPDESTVFPQQMVVDYVRVFTKD